MPQFSHPLEEHKSEMEGKALSKRSAVSSKSNPLDEVAEPLLTSTIAQARNGNLPTFLGFLCLPRKDKGDPEATAAMLGQLSKQLP